MKKGLDVFMYVLGAMIAISFFATIAFLVFRSVPELNKDLLNIAIGAEIGTFTMVVSYFYGSSKGSADKNQMIYDSTPPEKNKTT